MEEMVQNEMKWRVCPAMLQPWKGAFAWLAIAGTVIMIFDVNAIAGIGSLVFLLSTLGTFIFPSTFTIDSEGIHAKHTISAKYYTWEQVRMAKFFSDSCTLFSRKKVSLLGSNGMRVFFGKQAEDVISTIKSHLLEGTAT